MANSPGIERYEAVAREYGISLNRYYCTDEVGRFLKLSAHRLKIIRKEVREGKRTTLLVWSIDHRGKPQYHGWDIVKAIIGRPGAGSYSQAAE